MSSDDDVVLVLLIGRGTCAMTARREQRYREKQG